jgi:hypothetical protein
LELPLHPALGCPLLLSSSAACACAAVDLLLLLSPALADCIADRTAVE